MRRGFLIIGSTAIGIILLASLVLPAAVTRAEIDAAWKGEYFQNPNLEGKPAFTREDPVITFDWGDEPPGTAEELAEGWSGDYFSARWTRVDYFFDEKYIFAARSDDGVRMYLDDELIIDEWMDRQFHWTAVERKMTAGEHKIVVEFYEETGRAAIQAGYYPKNPLPTPTDTPKKSHTPTDTPTGGSGGSSASSGATRTPRPTSTPSLIGTRMAQTVTVAPQPSDAEQIVVEESVEKLFATLGFPGAVTREGGHGGSHAYVKNHSSKITFEAKWVFRPPERGFYDVFVYVPPVNDRATSAAVYQVFHNDQTSGQIIVDQTLFTDEFVQIGTFFFVPGKVQYVYLTNLTGEPDASREVLLDAVMFVFKP